MSKIDVVLAWARSFGIGGAFVVVTLDAFGSARGAVVVLAALKRDDS